MAKVDAVWAIRNKSEFLEQNEHFEEIGSPGADDTMFGNFHEIDEHDDEVWILQCPKGFDMTRLNKQKLKLPGRTNTADIEAVAMHSDEGAKTKQAFGYCTRSGRYAVKHVPITGKIVLRYKLPSVAAISDETVVAADPSTERATLPAQVKVRHPLLGYRFDEHIKTAKKAEQRLKVAEELSSKAQIEYLNAGKGCAKLKRAKSKSNTPNEELVILSSDEESGSKKKELKKTKTKLEENDDVTIPNKKTKKTKNMTLEDVSEDLQWLRQI